MPKLANFAAKERYNLKNVYLAILYKFCRMHSSGTAGVRRYQTHLCIVDWKQEPVARLNRLLQLYDIDALSNIWLVHQDSGLNFCFKGQKQILQASFALILLSNNGWVKVKVWRDVLLQMLSFFKNLCRSCCFIFYEKKKYIGRFF